MASNRDSFDINSQVTTFNSVIDEEDETELSNNNEDDIDEFKDLNLHETSSDFDSEDSELIEAFNETYEKVDKDFQFAVLQTKRNKPKLCSLGYYYVIDKKNKNFNWKCEKYPQCRGRAITNGL